MQSPKRKVNLAARPPGLKSPRGEQPPLVIDGVAHDRNLVKRIEIPANRRNILPKPSTQPPVKAPPEARPKPAAPPKVSSGVPPEARPKPIPKQSSKRSPVIIASPARYTFNDNPPPMSGSPARVASPPRMPPPPIQYKPVTVHEPRVIPLVSPEPEEPAKVDMLNLTPVTHDKSEPDFDSMPNSELEQWNAELDVKFGIMYRNYTSYFTPDFQVPRNVDVKTKYRLYKKWFNYINRLVSSTNTRWIIMLFFIGFEIFMTKFIGLDMGGYAIQQIKEFNQYQSMLIELGERNYLSIDSNYPVEIRLIFAGLIQAAIFLAIKYGSKWMGMPHEIVMGMVSTFRSTTGPPSDPPAPGQGPRVVDPPAQAGGLGGLLNGIMNQGGGIASLLGNLMGSLGGGDTDTTPVEP